jgi:hypothetical protein
MKVVLENVNTNHQGFQRLAELAQAIDPEADSSYDVDMSGVTWLAANMCAPLGGILHLRRTQGVSIRVSNLAAALEAILRKNRFLSEFGWEAAPDLYETTIAYRRFDANPAGASGFQGYVTKYFRPGSRGLPEMTTGLLRAFRGSLFELFENAVEHSGTEAGVFACGQFFPNNKQLDFSVADVGIGIRENIRRALGEVFTAEGAIEWAMAGNTTRRGPRPGGLGLRLIQELVGDNGGRLIMVSDSGCGLK